MTTTSVPFVAWKIEFGGNQNTKIQFEPPDGTSTPNPVRVGEAARLIY
jgi:hypothetical protein